MITSIDIRKLHSDPRNPNRMSPQTYQKLLGHMKRNGFCPIILVRPHPKKPGEFITIDGHHRIMAAKELGWTHLDCQVKEISKKDAGILLLTMNRLRGEDVPAKRAELIESLLPNFSMDELSGMLPESTAELEGLLALLQQDDAALEQALREQLAEEEKMLPVPLGFIVSKDEAEIVNTAIGLYKERFGCRQPQALVALCQDALTREGIA